MAGVALFDKKSSCDARFDIKRTMRMLAERGRFFFNAA